MILCVNKIVYSIAKANTLVWLFSLLLLVYSNLVENAEALRIYSTSTLISIAL